MSHNKIEGGRLPLAKQSYGNAIESRYPLSANERSLTAFPDWDSSPSNASRICSRDSLRVSNPRMRSHKILGGIARTFALVAVVVALPTHELLAVIDQRK